MIQKIESFISKLNQVKSHITDLRTERYGDVTCCFFKYKGVDFIFKIESDTNCELVKGDSFTKHAEWDSELTFLGSSTNSLLPKDFNFEKITNNEFLGYLN